MNKAELVAEMASRAGTDRRTAEQVIEAFIGTVASEAKAGRKVSWPGFGSFTGISRAARKGRNPRTGASVRIPASRSIRFSPSSTLKRELNAKRAAAKKAPAKAAAAKKAPARATGTRKAAARPTTARKSAARPAARKPAATRSPAPKRMAAKSTRGRR